MQRFDFILIQNQSLEEDVLVVRVNSVSLLTCEWLAQDLQLQFTFKSLFTISLRLLSQLPHC